METKRALVLSGGGAKGSFQSGVIHNLAKQGKQWDMVFGVSVGSINGAYIASHNKEQALEASEKLLSYWKEQIKPNTIYKKWFPIEFLNYPIAFFKDSLYNTKPLRKFLEKNLDIEALKKSNVDFIAGSTSFTTGNYVVAKKDDENIIDWIMASSAFPVAFPTIKIGKELYVDGGLRNCVPVYDALEAGATEVDIIINDPFMGHVKREKKPKNIIDIFMRTAEVLADEVFISDLEKCMKDFDAKITIYSPKEYLTEDSLNFEQKEIRRMIDLGLEIQEPIIVERTK